MNAIRRLLSWLFPAETPEYVQARGRYLHGMLDMMLADRRHELDLRRRGYVLPYRDRTLELMARD